jgi:hypothetical protein
MNGRDVPDLLTGLQHALNIAHDNRLSLPQRPKSFAFIIERSPRYRPNSLSACQPWITLICVKDGGLGLAR